MPELPEVETVCRGLAPVLQGHVLTRVILRRADLRRPFPLDFAARLEGKLVERLTRRAKYILLHAQADAGSNDGAVALIHLGMSGRMTIFAADAPAPGKHDHVDFVTDAGAVVRFTDPRRFGLMDLCSQSQLATHPLLADIGPEPLDATFDAAALLLRFKGRKGPLKTVLLDQRVVAGLGNIYVCEALFRAGLSPFRAAATVTWVEADRLIDAIKSVLQAAIASGGSSLRDHRQADGELGYFQHQFTVYGREGEPCPRGDDGSHIGADGNRIERTVQGGRSTFYCATCQG